MKKIVILVGPDFQDLEVMYPYYRLKEQGFNVRLAGIGDANYKGKYGYPVTVHCDVKDIKSNDIDCVVVPGGWAPDYLRRNKSAVKLVKDAFEKKKIVAAICHAGWLLCSAGILKGMKTTCFYAIKDDVVNAGADYVDKEVCVDKNLITSRMPDDLPAFCREIIKALNSK